MNAITIINTEHRNLESVLFTFDRLVKEIEVSGKTVPFSVFHGLLYYIDSFLDRFHHPKENQYLFPALLERVPESSAVIEQLGKQHGQGERLLLKVTRTLSAYEFLGKTGFPGFRDAVHEYVEFERAHIQQEEQDILPMAKRHLTPEDWAPIEMAFESNQDPLFGSAPSGEFRELFSSIISKVPAPYGLGPELT